MNKTKLMLGDNIESLKKLPDNSIDSVVSDPPYGLSFMNKKWDYDVPSVEFWKEVYRVLKPGGHILSFGGTRTYHRMVVNIEDAGFEIRDQIQWIYGSGFPKSLNIGKAVDKLEGNEREFISEGGHCGVFSHAGNGTPQNIKDYRAKITKGQSQFEGWGTALKPANEPICVARKPLSEKSVAENVLKWRTGGINVDGCRVGSETITTNYYDANNVEGCLSQPGGISKEGQNFKTTQHEGRFPANIIFECICDEVIKGEKGDVIEHNGTGGIWNESSGEPVGRTYNDKGDIHTNPDCPCRILDENSGITSVTGKRSEKSIANCIELRKRVKGNSQCDVGGNIKKITEYANDKGGASRFFYQAKVSKAERNMGLDGFEEKEFYRLDPNQNTPYTETQKKYAERQPRKNNHPTVKPVSLMSYLVRMVTPPNGIVLDPFMGSGSTGIAAQLEGFRFVGMEMDEDYFKIAEARINNFEKYKKFIKKND